MNHPTATRRGTGTEALARALGLQAAEDDATHTGWVRGLEVVLRGDVVQVCLPEGFAVSSQVRGRLPVGTVLTPQACHVSLRRQGVTRTTAIVRRTAKVLAAAVGERAPEVTVRAPEVSALERFVATGCADGLMALADASTDAAEIVAAIDALGHCGGPEAWAWLKGREARWFLPAAQRRALRGAKDSVARRLGVGALSVARNHGALALAEAYDLA